VVAGVVKVRASGNTMYWKRVTRIDLGLFIIGIVRQTSEVKLPCEVAVQTVTDRKQERRTGHRPPISSAIYYRNPPQLSLNCRVAPQQLVPSTIITSLRPL